MIFCTTFARLQETSSLNLAIGALDGITEGAPRVDSQATNKTVDAGTSKSRLRILPLADGTFASVGIDCCDKDTERDPDDADDCIVEAEASMREAILRQHEAAADSYGV
jgi:hypothetical protein